MDVAEAVKHEGQESPGKGVEREDASPTIIDGALDILLFLSRCDHEVGVRELARAVGMPKSSAARVVGTLKRRGFLLQNDATLQYRLGPRILEVAAGYHRTVELRRLALPDMSALAAATGESVFLGVLDGTDVVMLDRVVGPNPLRMMMDPGAREPVYCTGLGKVLLAGLPADRREALLRGIVLEPRTERTITTVEALRNELAAVAAQGYAFDNQEFQEGACCIAVPIREYGGAVVAALSIAGPAFRIALPRLGDLMRLVGDAGRTISHKVGFEIEKNDDFLSPDNSSRVSG